MSPDPEPPVRLTGREPGRKPTPIAPNGEEGRTRPGQVSRAALVRLAAVLLSAAGVLLSGVLWATHHGAAALRVLAGDVLALVVLLLAV